MNKNFAIACFRITLSIKIPHQWFECCLINYDVFLSEPIIEKNKIDFTSNRPFPLLSLHSYIPKV